jgi:DNA-binding transcriptional MerR regulator
MRSRDAQAAYTDTTSKLAREAEVTAPTVRAYANKGWLDFITASDGTRLFRAGQAPKVREIYAKRIAQRGRAPAAV